VRVHTPVALRPGLPQVFALQARTWSRGPTQLFRAQRAARTVVQLRRAAALTVPWIGCDNSRGVGILRFDHFANRRCATQGEPIMDNEEFLKQQFITLRSEIEARQSRLFRIVSIGIIGVPVATYFAASADSFVWISMPYFVLLLILSFIAEQNAMMRAGRFIREQVEKRGGFSMGWEEWLESRPAYRHMEAHFFAAFIVIFFLLYFVSVGMAMQVLSGEAGSDRTGQYKYWLYGAIGTYIIGAIWALSTLVQHWKSSVSTTDKGG
jgi:hypothetical protein